MIGYRSQLIIIVLFQHRNYNDSTSLLPLSTLYSSTNQQRSECRVSCISKSPGSSVIPLIKETSRSSNLRKFQELCFRVMLMKHNSSVNSTSLSLYDFPRLNQHTHIPSCSVAVLHPETNPTKRGQKNISLIYQSVELKVRVG